MPAVLNCQGDSGCAAWKNHGSCTGFAVFVFCFIVSFFIGGIKISVRITCQGKKKRRSVFTSGGYEKVVSLGKKSGKIRNRTESRNVFFSFFSVPLEKCSLSMDRFFCVSTGFFRWKSIFHLFPSCCIRKSLPVFFYVYMSLFLFTYASICVRTHARAKYIM